MSWDPLDDPSDDPPVVPPGYLVAIDLGLRMGIACFDRAGELQFARARRFPSRDRLRAAVPQLLADLSPLHWLVVEGDAELAKPWIRHARLRGAQVLAVKPETWRKALLMPRERRSGTAAKETALRHATEMLAACGRAPAVPLRHDAAEAALIGLWALTEIGWARG
ncbi:MAG: hypothetical protein KC502_17610 [Myxococcales bacterium]|nr:hypothetical protein [Myxococcales bacterium]